MIALMQHVNSIMNKHYLEYLKDTEMISDHIILPRVASANMP